VSTTFGYARPTTLSAALELLRDVPDARLLCGGTDLLVGLRKGTVHAPLVIDLKRVAELAAGIEERASVLRIGAATILADLIDAEPVRRRFPALVESAQVVGSIQIRNRATLAGNICNASPAADTAPALLVHDAIVEAVGPTGARRVPVAEFFVGPGRTALAPDELVSAVELPIPSEPIGAAFQRMTRRRGVDLATVSVCCAVSARGTTTFGLGAVGPRPLRVVDESGTLADPTADAEARDAVLGRLLGAATPISNVRGSREYREAMLLVLARRALAAARQRLLESADDR
jgi:carbon-monoxide dehydrogenase medium subunit